MHYTIGHFGDYGKKSSVQISSGFCTKLMKIDILYYLKWRFISEVFISEKILHAQHVVFEYFYYKVRTISNKLLC
jgi:hypothetical protein